MTNNVKLPSGDDRPLSDIAVQNANPEFLLTIVPIKEGAALLPLTLSVAQAGRWVGIGKTKTQELINSGRLITSRIDGRTLVLTSSVVALIQRHCNEGQLPCRG